MVFRYVLLIYIDFEQVFEGLEVSGLGELRNIDDSALVDVFGTDSVQ